MTPPLLFGLLFGVVGIQLSAAHGPSPEFPEQFQADTRMLIADNSRPNSRILCFDIPAHKVSHWVQVPPATMSIGLTQDSTHAIVVRGRDNDYQTVTVISTGTEHMPATFAVKKSAKATATTATMNGTAATFMRRAMVVKTLVLGKAMGGIEKRNVVYSKGMGVYIMQAEAVGTFFMIPPKAFTATGAFEPKMASTLVPGHYAVVPMPSDKNSFLFTNVRGGVIRLDMKGHQVANYTCPGGHGGALHAGKGWNKALFGCSGQVTIVSDGKVPQVEYLSTNASMPRVAAFIKGTGDVWWGYTDNTTTLWRISVAAPGSASSIRPVPTYGQPAGWWSIWDGAAFLGLQQNGTLTMYDGTSGAVLSNLPAIPSMTWAQVDEHVDQAIKPDLAMVGEHAYMTSPWTSEVVMLHLDKASKQIKSVEGKWNVGGMPTRMVMVSAQGK